LLQNLADSAQALVQEEAGRADGTVSGSIEFSQLKPRIRELWSKSQALQIHQDAGQSSHLSSLPLKSSWPTSHADANAHVESDKSQIFLSAHGCIERDWASCPKAVKQVQTSGSKLLHDVEEKQKRRLRTSRLDEVDSLSRLVDKREDSGCRDWASSEDSKALPCCTNGALHNSARYSALRPAALPARLTRLEPLQRRRALPLAGSIVTKVHR